MAKRPPKAPPKKSIKASDPEVVQSEVIEAEVIEAEVIEGEIEGEVVEDADLDEVIGSDGDDDGFENSRVIDTTAESTVAPPRTKALVPSKGRSLAVRDPLQAYINEAKRYALLTREQEHELAVRYREEGDLEAARKLVASNLRLVVKIAHQYRKAYRNLLDLVQEGNIGLMHAVKKFDPYRGVKLSSYAAWWIRAYILKFILNNWRMVKIGTTQNQRKLFFNLRKEVEKLRQAGIEDPGPKLLAERLDVAEHEVTSMQKRLSGRDVSLDAPLRSDEESSSTRMDMVEAHDAGPDEEVANRELSDMVQQAVRQFGRTLEGRDREIFELRTIAEEPLTLQEIGDRYGITRERSRQIERKIMDRLRDHLRAELGDAVDIHLGTSR